MIKDEEEFLSACLSSLEPLLSQNIEILIQDSGSTDRSLSIVEDFQKRSWPIQVFHYEWDDHFANARNHLAKKAHYPWVLFIDGDEVVDDSALELLGKSVSQTEVSCWSLIQRNYTHQHDIQGCQRLLAAQLPGYGGDSQGLYSFENWMERLYRKDQGLEFEGRIHESLIPSCKKLNLKFDRLPLVLHHYGRLKSFDAKTKSQYYLKLTEQKLKEEPGNAAAWIEWLRNLNEVGQHQAAYVFAQKAISHFPQEPEVYRACFQAALRADQFAQAQIWIEEFLKSHPEDESTQALLSTAFLFQKKWVEARKLAHRVLSKSPENFTALFNLGVISFEEKNWDDAKRFLGAAHRLKPDDTFIKSALERIEREMQS